MVGEAKAFEEKPMALAEDLRRQNAEELEQVSDLVDELEHAAPDQGPEELRRRLSAYLTQRKERLAASLKTQEERLPTDVGGVCEAEPREDEGEDEPLVTDFASFLRMKDKLLPLYCDKFVAFAGGRVVAASPSIEGLYEIVDAMSPRPEVCVEWVDEKVFEESPFSVITGLVEVREAPRKV